MISKDSLNYTVRQDILDSAAKLFSKRGYFGVSMQDIAKEVGLTKAGLYYHFESKDELIEHLLKSAVQELKKELKTAVQLSKLPTEALFNVIKTFFDFKIKHPEISLLSMSISSDESVPALQLIEDLQQELAKFVRELLGGLNLVHNAAVKTVFTLSSMVLGIVMSPFDAERRSPEEVANDVTAFLFQEPLGEEDDSEAKKQ